MADKTKIEWADATVNAINGCTVYSPGCTHCYAMKQAHRFDVRRGLTKPSKGGMVWTGEVRLNEKALLQPLSWKRPRRIFWNAHGDTFHEAVPDEWIDRVFAVCTLTPQHTHMILTKRSARMRDYLAARDDDHSWRIVDTALDMAEREFGSKWTEHWWRTAPLPFPKPLPNVRLGVSVEDQTRADERREDFRATPAAVKFVSYEPALGPVDWSGWEFVQQIIGGGESGPKARPMHPDWQRATRDYCSAHGIAYFFKQWGEWLPWEAGSPPEWESQNGQREDHHALFPADIDSDPRWDDGIWAVPEHTHFAFQRIGKKRAGRLLDGVEHNGMPGGAGHG
ncbi:MAG: hypothetical protein ABT11_20300 [Novosphingobium sp. SCN 66-18]|nr:MAG: hypothetical protein ABT11_20300 [Novosphingobium sp. SCN 66-18]